MDSNVSIFNPIWTHYFRPIHVPAPPPGKKKPVSAPVESILNIRVVISLGQDIYLIGWCALSSDTLSKGRSYMVISHKLLNKNC